MLEADVAIAAGGTGGMTLMALQFMARRMINKFDGRIDALSKELETERNRANDQHTEIELLKQKAQTDNDANTVDHKRLQQSVDDLNARSETRFTDLKSDLKLIQDSLRQMEVSLAAKQGE